MKRTQIMLYYGDDTPFLIDFDMTYIPGVGDGFYLEEKSPALVKEIGHHFSRKNSIWLHTIHIHLDPDV